MTHYPTPTRGDWITFHRKPVYAPACHAACRKPGGHKGYAEVGQVATELAERFWGRPVYEVGYWHPKPNGHLEALEARVSADRIISLIPQPSGYDSLITPSPAGTAAAATGMPRVLITISRSWADMGRLRDGLDWARRTYLGAILVHGDCPRGDRDAARLWRSWGLPDEPHPARWDVHGRAAGLIRNQHMVHLGADVCLAFIQGRSAGATHCARLAEQAGIRTYRARNTGPATNNDHNEPSATEQAGPSPQRVCDGAAQAVSGRENRPFPGPETHAWARTCHAAPTGRPRAASRPQSVEVTQEPCLPLEFMGETP